MYMYNVMGGHLRAWFYVTGRCSSLEWSVLCAVKPVYSSELKWYVHELVCIILKNYMNLSAFVTS